MGSACRWLLLDGAVRGALYGGAAATAFCVLAISFITVIAGTDEPGFDALLAKLAELAVWAYRMSVPIGLATGAVGGALVGLLAYLGRSPLQLLALVVTFAAWVVAVSMVYFPVDLAYFLLLGTWVPGQMFFGMVSGVAHGHHLTLMRQAGD